MDRDDATVPLATEWNDPAVHEWGSEAAHATLVGEDSLAQAAA